MGSMDYQEQTHEKEPTREGVTTLGYEIIVLAFPSYEAVGRGVNGVIPKATPELSL